MEKSKFKMIDEPFTCEVCGKQIKPLGYTARDHCPYCLSSKHVDINPGDREATCHGILKPVAIEPFKKGNYKIVCSLEFSTVHSKFCPFLTCFCIITFPSKISIPSFLFKR